MKRLIQKFSDIINGFLNGFDRIILKGSIMPIMHESGAANFCANRGILNKDFKDWMLSHTACIVSDAEELCMRQCNEGITYVNSSKLRKEALAHERQNLRGISSGLIGIWSAVEPCVTFRASFNKEATYPKLIRHYGKCKHLYFYYDHAQYGFMNIRLQTWFPYHIQIAMNGREWLRRSLERAGVEHMVIGNKFLSIGNYKQTQAFLDAQRDVHWKELLEGLICNVFPSKDSILGDKLSYYWTLWQSEMATDLIFDSAIDVENIATTLMRYAFMTGSMTNVMRYMNRPLRSDGNPRASCSDDIKARCMSFNDGVCVRFWANSNSVKSYSEKNVLRIETTTNDPSRFKAYRLKTGDSADTPKKLRALRKSVADLPLVAAKAEEVNERFMNQLAQCEAQTPVSDTFDMVSKALTKKGKRVRALELTGKDRSIIQAIADPKFSIAGITNGALREMLAGTSGYEGKSEKQLSAKVSRHLRLLRDHGLIKKMPRQNRYLLTEKGRQLTATLNATLAASTQQLMKIAA